MKPDFSSFSAPARPAITRPGPGTAARNGGQGDQEKKRVDYSHLDIIAEAERITERALKRHTRTTGKYTCQCPFDDCSSQNDAFLVFDRPELEDGQVHFWCNRCGRRGSLLDLVELMREQRTGEKPTWAEKCADLRIDPRTWRAVDAGEQSEEQQARRISTSEKRRRQAEQQRKAEQAELEMLDAAYRRARACLAAGKLTRADGTEIVFDQARVYLAERGFTLEQAAALGMAYIPSRQEIGGDHASEQLGAWRQRLLFPMTGPGGARGYAGRSLLGWKPGMTAERHKELFDAWNEKHPGRPMARHWKTRQVAYYGYEEACSAAILVIVEGEFDRASVCLALDGMSGIAVMAMGKNFQARVIPLNILHVILALDVDQAGQEAIARQKDELEARGVTVSIARPPAGKDWNDCHVQASLSAILVAIAAAISGDQGQARASAMPAAPARQAVNNINSLAQLDRCTDCGAPSWTITEDNHGYCKACWRALGHEPMTSEACCLCGDYADCVDEAALEDTGEEKLYCTSCWEKRSQQDQASEEPLIISTLSPEQGQAEQSEQGQPAFAEQVKELASVFLDGCTITVLPAGKADEYMQRYGAAPWPGEAIEMIGEEETTGENVLQNGDQDDFSAANNRCSKHGRALRYGDELAGRYCSDTDCWERYRLMRAGAKLGYPALFWSPDPRNHLADTSKAPLYFIDLPNGERMPVYPCRPARQVELIAAGADAWRDFSTGRAYQYIDYAIKAVIATRRASA